MPGKSKFTVSEQDFPVTGYPGKLYQIRSGIVQLMSRIVGPTLLAEDYDDDLLEINEYIHKCNLLK